MDFLESIASRYEGEAKVQRLQWIASRSSSSPARAAAETRSGEPTPAAAAAAATEGPTVSNAAYRMLADHFQRTGNTTRYKELFVHLNNLASSSAAAVAASSASNATAVAGAAGAPGGEGPAGEAAVGAGALAPAPAAPPSRLPIAIDPTWLSSQELRNRQAREALASRLSQAQAHLHKDAIRAAYLALAEHEMVRGGGGSAGGTIGGHGSSSLATSAGGAGGQPFLGSGAVDLSEAFHLTLRAKDYCVTRSQTAAVSLQILELALALSNYVCVREYVVKLEHTIDSSSGTGTGSASSAPASAAGSGSRQQQQQQQPPSGSASPASAAAASLGPEVAHRVKIASALETLYNGDYARAASILMRMTTGRLPGSASPARGGGDDTPHPGAHDAGLGSTSSWPSVLCGEEIALYTGLLALCALSRQDVLALAEHTEALELSPSVREALWQFHRGNYQASWALLNWPQLALDYHLGRHIPALQGLVVKRAILAYWTPCLRVDLPTMARDLEGLVPSSDVLLKHMADAISQAHAGKGPGASASQLLLDTRIDLPNRVLVRDVVDEEVEAEHSARSKLEGLTTSVLDDSYGMIVRLACLEHKLVAKSGASKSASSSENEGRGGVFQRLRGRDRSDRMGGGGGGGGGSRSARGGVRRPYRPVGRPHFDDDVVSSSDDDDDDDDGVNDDAADADAAEGIHVVPGADDDPGFDAGVEGAEEHVMIDVSDDMNPEDLY